MRSFILQLGSVEIVTPILIMVLCWTIGTIIKHKIKFIDNRLITIILVIAGTLLNLYMYEWQLTPNVLIDGVVFSWASTGGYETMRNVLSMNATSKQAQLEEIVKKFVEETK